VTSPSPGVRTYQYHLQKPERSRFHCRPVSCLLLVVTCIQVELIMRIWALQRPDLNRLQKTITTACDKERFVRPQERALISTHAKQILNVRPRENSKTKRILLAKNRREKNPQLPAKQGESRDVTFPRRTHVPISPPKARAKPFSFFWRYS